MKRPMPPFTRRCFALSLLLAPLACLGCGADGVSVNEKTGEKRQQKMEDLQKRTDLERKSGAKNAPSR